MRSSRVSKLPSLLRQEATASLQLLRLLLRMYSGGDAGLRALAERHLGPLAASMVERYTRLAIAAEHARTAATPAFMHAAAQFGGEQAPPSAYDAASLAAPPAPPAPAQPAAAGYGYYPALPPAGGAAAEAAPPTSSLGLDARELFRETAAYGPLVLTLLQGILAWDEAQFRASLSWVYPLLTGLVVAGNLELRGLVAGVFNGRLAAMLPLAGALPAATSEGVGEDTLA